MRKRVKRRRRLRIELGGTSELVGQGNMDVVEVKESDGQAIMAGMSGFWKRTGEQVDAKKRRKVEKRRRSFGCTKRTKK